MIGFRWRRAPFSDFTVPTLTRLPDISDARPDARPDARIDYIVGELLARRQIPVQTQRLKTLGASGVPHLLSILASGDRQHKTIAFFGLQYCWAPEAVAAVQPFLASDDVELQRMAAIVLVKGSGYDTLVELCLPLITDPRPAVASFALDHVESERPDIERIRRLLWQPAMRPALVPHLPRYHAADLIPGLLHLLERPGPGELVPLLAALIHTNADAVEVRSRVSSLLAHDEPSVRAMAAEYLTWHGGCDEVESLKAARKRETDSYPAAAHLAAAHLAAAKQACRRLPRPQAIVPDQMVGPTERRAAYEQMAHRLGQDDKADPSTLGDAWALYRFGEHLEPHWAYRGAEPPPGFAAERMARIALQARLFAIPGAAVPATEWRDTTHLPQATLFTPPHSGYNVKDTSNFGLTVDETAVEGFNGLVHIGDDTAWHQPLTAVHSIAAGVVRLISCTLTWGVMVIIEHREPNGRSFCSLYAHLSPFVTVPAGCRVNAGEKIGAVGRAYTWENGGYAAHLHFGIHDGPFIHPPKIASVIDVRYQGKPRRGSVIHADSETTILRIGTSRGTERAFKPTSWLAGYVSAEWWKAGDHGWLDPRPFLAARCT